MDQLSTTGYRVEPICIPLATMECLLALIQANPYNAGFGIREFLPNNPAVSEKLRQVPMLGGIMRKYFDNPVCVRSIYFDKPPKANWVVGWHQDLTMNLRSRPTGEGWQNIRQIKYRIVGQPPLALLEAMVTLRIHLDDTDESNGALRVVPSQHREGIIRTDTAAMASANEQAILCRVPKGGVLLMKPLTPHASRRTTNGTSPRRVIHLEFLDRAQIIGLDLQEATVF